MADPTELEASEPVLPFAPRKHRGPFAAWNESVDARSFARNERNGVNDRLREVHRQEQEDRRNGVSDNPLSFNERFDLESARQRADRPVEAVAAPEVEAPLADIQADEFEAEVQRRFKERTQEDRINDEVARRERIAVLFPNSAIARGEAPRRRPAFVRGTNGGSPHKKSLGVAILLWVFLGLFGAHRFYLGFWRSGLVRLFTLNFLGIGYAVDGLMVVELYNKQDGWLNN